MWDNTQWKHTQRVLDTIGKRLVTQYRQALQDKDINTTEHSLSDSVKYEIDMGERWIEVNLSLLDYWKYVEYGTRPHWAPKAPIERWITVKPLLPVPDKNGRLLTPKQQAYLVRRKIAQYGTEAKNVLSESLNDVMYRFNEALEEAVTKDVSAGVDILLLQLQEPK